MSDVLKNDVKIWRDINDPVNINDPVEFHRTYYPLNTVFIGSFGKDDTTYSTFGKYYDNKKTVFDNCLENLFLFFWHCSKGNVKDIAPRDTIEGIIKIIKQKDKNSLSYDETQLLTFYNLIMLNNNYNELTTEWQNNFNKLLLQFNKMLKNYYLLANCNNKDNKFYELGIDESNKFLDSFVKIIDKMSEENEAIALRTIMDNNDDCNSIVEQLGLC